MAWRVPGDDVLSRCNFGAEAGRRAAQASHGFLLFLINRVDAQSRKSHPQRGILMYVPYVCNKHHQDCDLQVSSPPGEAWMEPSHFTRWPQTRLHSPSTCGYARPNFRHWLPFSLSLAFSPSESPDAIP